MRLALLHWYVMPFNADCAVGGTHDAAARQQLLHTVGTPAGYTGGGKQRREYILGNAQHGIHKARVHIHICAHGRCVAAALLQQRNTQLLDLLQKGKFLGVALDLGHMLRVFLQQLGTWVGYGVHRVAQSVQLAGAVAGFLIQQLYQIVADRAVVMRVNVLLDIAEHLP